MVKTETLQQLNPAVAWLLLNGNNAKLTDLLRLTFFDLINRKILKITEEEYGPRDENDPPTMPFVQLGDGMEDFKPLPHEEVFTKFFQENPRSKMMLPTIVKLARRKAANDLVYLRRIYLHGTTAPLFKRNLWHILTGGFGLSDAGLLTQKQLQREFEEVKHAFRQNAMEDEAAAQKLVISLGAMALMVPGLNLAQAQASEEAFKQARNADHPATNVDGGLTTSYTSGCSTSGSDVSWAGFSGIFDSGCSGHGHGGHGGHDGGGWGGDSGCSGSDTGGGDSGCSSGCSGCGGGCGGD